MKKSIVFISLLIMASSVNAQEEDLLKGLDSGPEKEYVTNAFKSSRVINGHSMEMIGAGVLDVQDFTQVRTGRSGHL